MYFLVQLQLRMIKQNPNKMIVTFKKTGNKRRRGCRVFSKFSCLLQAAYSQFNWYYILELHLVVEWNLEHYNFFKIHWNVSKKGSRLCVEILFAFLLRFLHPLPVFDSFLPVYDISCNSSSIIIIKMKHLDWENFPETWVKYFMQWSLSIIKITGKQIYQK